MLEKEWDSERAGPESFRKITLKEKNNPKFLIPEMYSFLV